MHVDAVKKNSRTYEHIEPELVGNRRRILLSDLSGRANVELKAKELGIELDPQVARRRARSSTRLKQLEADGYQFESAGASFKLFMLQALGTAARATSRCAISRCRSASATRTATTQGETRRACASSSASATRSRTPRRAATAPSTPWTSALRSLIDRFYPQLQSVQLVDYKVRVLASDDGTGSVVRVLIQSSDGDEVWGTVGVSPNIIHASWNAMVDALEYKLVKDGVEPFVASERARRHGSVAAGSRLAASRKSDAEASARQTTQRTAFR